MTSPFSDTPPLPPVTFWSPFWRYPPSPLFCDVIYEQPLMTYDKQSLFTLHMETKVVQHVPRITCFMLGKFFICPKVCLTNSTRNFWLTCLCKFAFWSIHLLHLLQGYRMFSLSDWIYLCKWTFWSNDLSHLIFHKNSLHLALIFFAPSLCASSIVFQFLPVRRQPYKNFIHFWA